jgi:GNAT superfamily N-acetyltransferase
MNISFVAASSPDFRMLATKLDAYYFELVGDIQNRYAEVNRPENMTALAVAYEDGVPIACGAWKRIDGATAELKRLYVLPEYRRRGAASSLIAALEADAAVAGIRRMILETAVDTADSHRLYLSAGYRIMDYYGSPAAAENCLCFHKEL